MKIELTDKEIKLLMGVLKETASERAEMSCNDAYSKEEKLFSKKERKIIAKEYLGFSKDELKDLQDDGFLANFHYVEYLLNRIKKQVK